MQDPSIRTAADRLPDASIERPLQEKRGRGTFYPLTRLNSNFLGYSDSNLVDFGPDELLNAFERVKRLKQRFLVVNPTPSLEEMQRYVRGEEQRFPCLGGCGAAKAVARRGNLGSLRAVLEELPWLLKF